ncbi:MAG: glycosyltransferase, partial [Nanoarchaeota archaeon]
MRISIIIPIYNFTQELYQLTVDMLKSIKTTIVSKDDNLEIIIIDNGSTVGEVKDWPDIYIRNKINLGFCKAVNQGFKLATGDLITVANNDIRVSPNWFEVTKEIFNSNPKVGS